MHNLWFDPWWKLLSFSVKMSPPNGVECDAPSLIRSDTNNTFNDSYYGNDCTGEIMTGSQEI